MSLAAGTKLGPELGKVAEQSSPLIKTKKERIALLAES
jgi:hypothetical protein